MEETGGSSAASSDTTVLRQNWDVFLSFRGEDTRKTFINGLYDALYSKDVQVFRDNDGIKRGDEIKQSLLDAIEDSASAIAVISPRYADSHWCLEELARLCDLGKLVLPVFYEVDPSAVRGQKPPFQEDMKKLEVRHGEEKVARWRKAMATVGGLSGWVHGKREEPHEDLIKSLVKRILTAVNDSPVVVAPYIVGLDSPMKELMELLNLKSHSPQVIALLGTGGIGKTTICKALYNKLVKHFDRHSFISNVRATFSRPDGLLLLQNKLIKDLSKVSVREFENVNDAKEEIKQKLMANRVLVVIDDIDDSRQLSDLGFCKEWLFEGSKIIINTRNRDALPNDLVNTIYQMSLLDQSNSLKLFSYYAFRREKPTNKAFLELSDKIVSITGGLPLALQVLGSSLYDKRSTEEWYDAIGKLKKIRPKNLQDILKISFDALDNEVQCVFLDIACLLLNLDMTRLEIIDVMKGCGFAESAMTTLIERSLIRVIEEDKLWMHDQIRDMGREIVFHECDFNIGNRSRIWEATNVMEILEGQKGTDNVQGMILDFEVKNWMRITSTKTIAVNQLRTSPNFAAASSCIKEIYRKKFQHNTEEEGNSNEVRIDTKSFQSMKNLRLLQFSNIKLEGSFSYVPDSLKWLQWRKCSLKSLPCDFFPKELKVLDLSESKIERVWDENWFWNRQKVANKLMILNLYNCYNITSTPDLSQHMQLEKLILEKCTKLERIHKSVGDLNALKHLNLMRCPNLVEFPSDVSGLKNLQVLLFTDCSKLKILPQNIGNMTSLKELSLDNTAIEKLPETIFRLSSLETLSMKGCIYLKELPKCIGKLSALRELSFSNCSALVELPHSIGSLGNLEELNLMWCSSLTLLPDSIGNLKSLANLLLSGSSVKVLPESIGSLCYLKQLLAGKCQGLDALPISIKGLSSMIELDVSSTAITCLPDEIGLLKSLKKLEIKNCENLTSLPKSIGNLLTLDTLNLFKSFIVELPESIGELENLNILNLNECKKLRKLPESIGNLKNLRHLLMEHTVEVTELPESFGDLNLMILRMGRKPDQEGSAERNVSLPSSFPNHSLLEELHARGLNIRGELSDGFNKLVCLEILDLSYNDFCSFPSNLSGLSLLKNLIISHCKKLIALPPLPSSLEELNAANCVSLERLSDLSNLLNLQELNLTNCSKLVDIPGIECFISLRRLYMGGWNSHASTQVQKLSKIALRNLRNLSMPGSEIPHWFTQNEVSFSKRKNHSLKSLIIVAIISISPEFLNESREKLPVAAIINAQIIRLNTSVFSTALNLKEAPSTQEDQLYLCRYPHYHPLVSILKDDGDIIKVIRGNNPINEGVVLRECGIHLVYENDDHYEGEEKDIDENLQTVSQKLTTFFG
ncbi:hypothetical protein ACJIZ3_020225 [Penstemon smallii]|uniref:TIR domain-containing protein n=1 Tax=Penstemon smallii TaxID=265156 RepID=A0ABD3SI06_9LAMI